jgi:hypothetical protein
MIITFEQIWYFIETTYVTDDVVEILHPETGQRISTTSSVT